MKPKIEKGSWDTTGLFIAQVRDVRLSVSYGCIPGVEDGNEVCWNNETLECIAPVKPEWNLVKRAGDLPADYDGEIFKPSKTTAKPSTFEVRPTQWTMTPSGKPIFDERAMTLKIEDESGGEFLVLENCGDVGSEKGFRFDVEEWPALRALIDEAVKGVRKGDQ